MACHFMSLFGSLNFFEIMGFFLGFLSDFSVLSRFFYGLSRLILACQSLQRCLSSFLLDLSIIFHDLSTIFQDLSTIFQDLSTIFQDLSTIFQDLSTFLFSARFPDPILVTKKQRPSPKFGENLYFYIHDNY
jgi:hypothetical protein